MIVVGAPCRNCAAGMAQRREQVFVEALFAHPPVEAFHRTILHGLAWCDVMPTNFAVFLPLQHRVARQFRAVVRDHHARVTAQFCDAIQLEGDTSPAVGYVRDGCQAFPAKVVNNIQHREPPRVFQRVGHEVERPPLVRPLRVRHG